MLLNTKPIYQIGTALATVVLLILNVRLYPPGSVTYSPNQLGQNVKPVGDDVVRSRSAVDCPPMVAAASP